MTLLVFLSDPEPTSGQVPTRIKSSPGSGAEDILSPFGHPAVQATFPLAASRAMIFPSLSATINRPPEGAGPLQRPEGDS